MQTSKYKFFIEEMEQNAVLNDYKSKSDKFESIDFYSATNANARLNMNFSPGNSYF